MSFLVLEYQVHLICRCIWILLEPLSCYCLWRVIPTLRPVQGHSPSLLSCSSGPCSFCIKEGLAVISEACKFVWFHCCLAQLHAYSEVVFSLIPLKRSGNLIAFMADIPGSYLREVAKRIKYKMLACSVPERKENMLDYTLVPRYTTRVSVRTHLPMCVYTYSHRQLRYSWYVIFFMGVIALQVTD